MPQRRAPGGAHGGTVEGEAAPLGCAQKGNDQRTNRGILSPPAGEGAGRGDLGAPRFSALVGGLLE